MLRTAALAVCLLAGTAAADGPAQAVATYAIVVGSNGGGPGQVTLRYAEDDARRVGDVLAELGGYTRDHVDVVLHPTPDQLRDRLTKLAMHVKDDVAAGRQAQIFFYYSGHARASAIDLGNDELPLEELRARLFDVPATLTVVVLDACQSGAFSRIKGAAPAADFSFNSRQHLDATGVAVLASSSGSELSQESEQLHSSYFTHHLLVGLRGAGDANGDGQVSIDEAYRYAYNQTLLATAETAVGGQHVTFEADLKGHGEVPLSFPRAATASIELPARLEGKTLVEDKRAHAVIAETYKARGAAVRIAVAPGDYEVVVRQGETLSRCEVTAPGTIDLDRCRSEALVKNPTKGGGFEHPTTIIEVGGMLGVEREDDYTNRLKTFGYQEDLIPLTSTLEIAALRQVAPRLWVGGIASAASLPQWTHDIAGSNTGLTFDWQLYTIGPVVRGEQHLTDIRLFGHQVARFDVYAQLAAGLAIGRTELVDAMNKTTTTTDAGPAFDVGAGTHFADLFGSGLGLSIGGSYGYAPAFTDLIGDTHAGGGFRLDAALSFRR